MPKEGSNWDAPEWGLEPPETDVIKILLREAATKERLRVANEVLDKLWDVVTDNNLSYKIRSDTIMGILRETKND